MNKFDPDSPWAFVALIAVICAFFGFLCWVLDSPWPLLILLLLFA